jgi:hypothetical protein
MAIDDVAQGSGHDILDATAQAAATVSLAHGLCPIRRGMRSIKANNKNARNHMPGFGIDVR